MSLYYEDFGAYGDGIHDDFEAIIKCHENANRTKESVKAKDGAVYFIGGAAQGAVISTDVDWGNATFIIDDSKVENRRTAVFYVMSDEEPVEYEITGPLGPDTDNINNPYKRPVYVRIFSKDRTRFIRKGLNMDNGVAQNDCFMVSADGKILTDIDWEYESITSIKASFCDDAPIRIKGGVFKTRANYEPSFYNYYRRGIDVLRSNAVLENITHYVLDEKEHGAPYEGFIYIDECVNVTISNCLLTPHITYWTESKIPGEQVPMGSYDIRANAVVGLKLKGLRQTVDINKKEYWGLMCSNFCKDMELKDCIISRFDAHMGVTNLNISDCIFGHVGINLIGHGRVTVERTKSYGNYFVGLREDYGSNFDGELIIKDCYWKPSSPDNNELIRAHNEGNHDFGYECHLTGKLTVINFTVDDKECDDIYIFPDYDSEYESGKSFKYLVPAEANIAGISLMSGRKAILYKNNREYGEMKVSYEI